MMFQIPVREQTIAAFLLALTACSAPSVAPTAAPTSTVVPIAPAPTITPIAAPTAAPVPTVAPTASVAAIATSTAVQNPPADPFAVVLAQDVLDGAGFHDMATVLSTTQKIDAAYLGSVIRVRKVLSQAVWPAPVRDQARVFVDMLDAFASALTAGNVKAAVMASAQVHEAQHALSHAIDAWIEAQPSKPGEASPFKVSLAQDVMDTAGFHGMAETLNTARKIDGAFLGTVNRVVKILRQATWPPQLAGQGTDFVTALGVFAAALSAGNLTDAAAASDVVHDSQHELSAAIDAWLASKPAKAATADAFSVRLAQNVMDTAGFHGMAEAISNTRKISAAWLSTMTRANKILAQTGWPAPVAAQGQEFVSLMGKFSAALTAGNVRNAVAAAENVHDAQRELSAAIDAWAAQLPK